jgi:hypothetical protein
MANKWSREVILHKLLTDVKWLERGILALYARQTADEQKIKETHRRNGEGFNKPDAVLLSNYAELLNMGRHLSEKQLFIARKKMRKYASQLTRIANSKIN